MLELRSPRGRFVDRGTWRAGESKVVKAALRPAFAIVGLTEPGVSGLIPSTAAAIERVLQEGATVLVYTPVEAELKAALVAENLSAQGLAKVVTEGSAERSQQQLRDIGRRLAARLEAQGIAWVSSAPGDSGAIAVAVLASGSARADVLTFRPADAASRSQIQAALARPAPPPLRPALEVSVVDVADVAGAAVVRVPAGGAGAEAGLAPGEVIVGAADRPVKSVAELQAQVASATGPLSLQVRGRDGRTRSVSVAIVESPNLIPLRERTLLCNKVLLEMRDAVQMAKTPQGRSAARLNLAIAQMCVGNWEEALRELEQVTLPERPGVSSGTVAYLTGLCQEALGRAAEARAAFERAAAATESTLGVDGLPVRLLVQQKLGPVR